MILFSNTILTNQSERVTRFKIILC